MYDYDWKILLFRLDSSFNGSMFDNDFKILLIRLNSSSNVLQSVKQ